MSSNVPFKFAPLALTAALAFVPQAQAATQVVEFNVLNATATLATPFAAGDVLALDTFVTTPGALLQTINFTVGSSITGLFGEAVWEISTAAGPGPRLTGVNIDIFNNATNALVVSDTFAGTLAGFAVSTFANTPLTAGSYRLVATGTGVRESSLNVSVSFIPEPGTYGMMAAGLAAIGLMIRRRSRA